MLKCDNTSGGWRESSCPGSWVGHRNERSRGSLPDGPGKWTKFCGPANPWGGSGWTTWVRQARCEVDGQGRKKGSRNQSWYGCLVLEYKNTGHRKVGKLKPLSKKWLQWHFWWESKWRTELWSEQRRKVRALRLSSSIKIIVWTKEAEW